MKQKTEQLTSFDVQYKELIQRIINEGIDTPDRTGVGARKTFGAYIRVDLSTDVGEDHLLPVCTLRNVFPRISFEEMKWMLSGSTDATELQKKNIHIWDGNTSREFLDQRGLYDEPVGSIGKGYGKQFRDSSDVDQLASVVDGLITDPNSRRHLINLWNVSELDEMSLVPCHYVYQFVVTGDKINLQFNLRSSDVILGLPTNMMFSAFFLTFVADLLGYKVGTLTCSISDAHIYQNHLVVASELLEKEPYPMPSFKWNVAEKGTVSEWSDVLLDRLQWDEVEVLNHQTHEKIDRERLTMAV